MKEDYVWFKDRITEKSKANVGLFSPTAQFGINVFETVRAYNNITGTDLNCFRLLEHISRLLTSAKIIGIPTELDVEKIHRILRELIKKNNVRDDCSFRIILFLDGNEGWQATSPGHLGINMWKTARQDPHKKQPICGTLSAWTRITDNSMPPLVKAGANYLNGRYAHLKAVFDGYDVPIFLDQHGFVSEGAGACLFIVRDGKLITPALSSSILESITRDTVKWLSSRQGFSVEERQVNKSELYFADELFLCGTSAEITPISRVDQFKISGNKIGPITKALYIDYLNAVSAKVKCPPQWHCSLY